MFRVDRDGCPCGAADSPRNYLRRSIWKIGGFLGALSEAGILHTAHSWTGEWPQALDGNYDDPGCQAHCSMCAPLLTSGRGSRLTSSAATTAGGSWGQSAGRR